jgi:DNA-binding FrmR family transcriptional regulator
VTVTMPGTTTPDPVAARLHRIEGQTRALARLYEVEAVLTLVRRLVRYT